MALYNKKEKESKCLQLALDARKTQHGQSRRILDLLSGSEFPRCSSERPDFVKLYTHNENSTLVGIEHFRVDQLSLQKKDSSVASTGVRTERDIAVLYDKWHKNVQSGEYDQEKLVVDLAELVGTHIKNKEQSTYNTFVESFKYSLQKHVKSIDSYLKELNDLSRGRYPTKLIFLIEIHTELRNLFLNDSKGTRKHRDGITPMFEDIVDLIEKTIDPKKVDYIILCLGETVYTDNVKVLALPTQDFRKQLSKRKIKIYTYVGSDFQLDSFQLPRKNVQVTPVVALDGNSSIIHFNTSFDTINDQNRLDMAFYAFYHALEAKKYGLNVATTCDVQLLLESSAGKEVVWTHPPQASEPWVLHPIFRNLSQKEFEEKCNDFEKKYYSEIDTAD